MLFLLVACWLNWVMSSADREAVGLLLFLLGLLSGISAIANKVPRNLASEERPIWQCIIILVSVSFLPFIIQFIRVCL